MTVENIMKLVNEYGKAIVEHGWFDKEDRARKAHDALLAAVEELAKDAERYRWLRAQHWADNKIAVIIRPKDQSTLGSLLPSDKLLDDTIDHMKGQS